MVVKKRKAPEGDKIPVLQEDALLACLEAESIKEINAVRLWKWVIENPTSDNWDEVPWEALELPRKMKEVVPRHFVLHSSRVAERFDSADGTTTKLLVRQLSVCLASVSSCVDIRDHTSHHCGFTFKTKVLT